MAVNYTSTRFAAEDDNGRPLSAGKLYTYLNGTTTPAVTYGDIGGNQPNTNPIILNARGECVIYLQESQNYTFVLTDSKGALIWTQNNISGIASSVDFETFKDTVAGVTGAAQVGFRQPTSGAVARTVDAKLREVPSVLDFGAVGDYATNNSAAFTAMEADAAHSEFYVPQGVFLCGLTALKKRYVGPGAVINPNGFGAAGTPASILRANTTGITGCNTGVGIAPRSIVVIGDSIPDGSGVTADQSWPSLMQKWTNLRLPFGQGSYLSGANLERTVDTGTITRGTTGPLGAQTGSKILAVGATMSITADWIDFVAFYFNRQPGAGTVTIKKGASLYATIDCSGVAQPVTLSAYTPNMKGRAGETYTLTCSVAPVEINGIVATHQYGSAADMPVFIQTQCRGGATIGDYSTPAVLDAIRDQTLFRAHTPIYCVCVGTNNIYNTGRSVTPEQTRTDLEAVVSGLLTRGGSVVLGVPLRAGNGSYTPLYASYDVYRDIYFEVARKYGVDIVDQGELDLLRIGGYQGDQLHPNAGGYQIEADFWFRKLGMGGLASSDLILPIELVAGTVAASAPYGTPNARLARHAKVLLSGTQQITTFTLAKGATIARVPMSQAPTTFKTLYAVGTTGGGAGVQVVLTIDTSGTVVVFDYSAPFDFLSFEGITYNIDD